MSRTYFYGEWIESAGPLTVEEVSRICRKGREVQPALARYPIDKVLRLLGTVRDRWADPHYYRRVKLQQVLALETGFSPEMLSLAFDELVWVLDPHLLQQKLDKELPYAFSDSPRQHPLGTVLHVLSGNVFLVGAGSLVEGLITKNVSILKTSSGETHFLPELIESILECDEDRVVSQSICLVSYSSNQRDVIAEFKRRVDGIVLWGGEEAVRAYRDNLPARTRLIVFGPKLSLSLITKAGIQRLGLEPIARLIAQEIAIWDQNACTAPQIAYVEGEREAHQLVEALAIAMENKSLNLPPGVPDLNTAVEIGKMRSVFEIAEARGIGLLRQSRKGVDWTIVLDRERAIEPSPLHRTLRVVGIQRVEELLEEIEKLRGYIQTIGLASSPQETAELSPELGSRGALRVVELGRMSGGSIDDPHDGQFDLPQLVNLVVNRPIGSQSPIHWLDTLPVSERTELINARLRTLVDRARKAPFYAERLKNLKIDTLQDLPRIPPLQRQQMEDGMPPRGDALCTGDWTGGYVTRSGGSTGEPKFSIYDKKDWERSIDDAVRIFEAAGLTPGDRLANCMLAGDLYGSFVSFDHINYRVGVTSFAFAGHVNPKTFVEVWKKFKFNVVQAIPTILVPLLRAVKQIEPEFCIEKIIYAGTPLTTSDFRWIKNTLGTKRIASIIGANDGNQLAYQCNEMSGPMHHLIDDYNFVEIIDSDGRPVPEGTSGKILITSLLKFAFPLIRYEIGDAGRIVPGQCNCGRTTRMLEYLGRSDDTLCIGNMNLRFQDISSALSEFPLSALQLLANSDENGEFLELNIEAYQTQDLDEKVRRALYDRVKNLRARLEDGSLHRLDIHVVAPGAIERNPRTGKIRQWIDARH